MITVEGIDLDLAEDFESGEASEFALMSAQKADISIDHRSAVPPSDYGLHFEGGGQVSGWQGGPNNTTHDQAWNENTDFQASASNCSVDATGIEGVGLVFDLRQTYSVGTTYSWFRVLVNGEQVSDINGVSDFNPVTNTDPFVTETFDLSSYGNSMFSVTLQSAICLLPVRWCF